LDAWRNADTSNSGTIELSKFMTSLTEVGFVEMNLLSLLKASGACHVRYEEFFHNLFDGTQSEPFPSVQKCVVQGDDCEGDAGLASPLNLGRTGVPGSRKVRKRNKSGNRQRESQETGKVRKRQETSKRDNKLDWSFVCCS